MLFSVSRSFMPGCQRCPFRLKASVQELENNIQRYREQPCNARYFSCTLQAPTLPCGFFHSYAVYPIPVLRGFNLSSAVVRARNKMQRGMWLVERSFPDKPKVVTRHSGVSYARLPVRMMRHSPLHASTSALGKGLSQPTSVLLANATRFPVPTRVSSRALWDRSWPLTMRI